MASASPPRTPCWHCKHMVAVDARSSIVQCGLSGRSNGTPHKTRGGEGCDSWEREPGIDDDDWDPPNTPRIAPYVPEPPPAPRGRNRGTDGWWTEPRRPQRPVAEAPETTFAAFLTRDPFRGYFLQDDD